MSMPLKNVIFAIIMLTLGMVYAYLSSALPERSIPGVPGPSFFPNIVSGLIIILSVSLLLKGAIALRRETSFSMKMTFQVKGTVTILIFLAFIVALPYVGFVAAGIPFFGLMMLLCSEFKPLQVVLGSIIIPVALYFLFREGFSILLPTGQWM